MISKLFLFLLINNINLQYVNSNPVGTNIDLDCNIIKNISYNTCISQYSNDYCNQNIQKCICSKIINYNTTTTSTTTNKKKNNGKLSTGTIIYIIVITSAIPIVLFLCIKNRKDICKKY